MRESSVLETLRRVVARADSGAAVAGRHAVPTGHADLDAALGGGLESGRLHEIFADNPDDAAGASGFATALGLRVNTASAPLLWLRTDVAQRASGKIFMPGFAEFGGHPGRVVLALVDDDRNLLKAAQAAATCNGLCSVIVECWGKAPLLTLTASRKLALAAEKSGVTLFVLRIGGDAFPSAAATRWRVSSAPSIALAPNAPGHSMFEIELLRRRAGPAGMRWFVEWDRDACALREAPHSGAVVSVPEHRALHEQRPVRRRFA